MERDKLLGTMDAKVWTDEFMATKARLGNKEFDHAMMLAWFANAIMAGFDEANRRAQRALDAEREKVNGLEAELEEYRSIAEQQGASKAVSELATLQAQAKQLDRTLADVYQQRDGLQAQLRQVEGERAKWEDIAGLRFAGDHKFVKEMELLKIEHAKLRQLVEALPVVDGRMDVECGACYYIRSFIAGQYGVVCGLITEQSTAMAIKALLEYRATQAAQDAGAKLPAWVNEAMRLAPTQTNPPHPTEEQS